MLNIYSMFKLCAFGSLFAIATTLMSCTSSGQEQSAQKLDAPLEGVADWRQILVDVHQMAIDQMLASSRSDDPFMRANAIETAKLAKGRVLPLTQLAVEDEHPAVRFSALVTAGQLQLAAVVPAARRHLDDSSDSVRAAAIFAIHRCGEPVDLNPLADMLTKPEPTTRGNVAMLIGMMDQKSAVPMLKDLAKVPLPRTVPVEKTQLVRLQMAEAVLSLTEDEGSLHAVRASPYSQFDEVRIQGVLTLAQIGDRRMETAVAKLLEDPPIQLQLAAARYLAQFRRYSGLKMVKQATKSAYAPVRAQACMTLGWFPGSMAVPLLSQQFSDNEEQVRLSAAAAVLRLQSYEDSVVKSASGGESVDYVGP